MAHRVDVAVIGAGMAGASIGAELAARGASVALLEAESAPGRHTTGRSAASYTPAYGNATVRALTARSLEQFDRIATALGHPVLTPRPALWVADDTTEGRAALRSALDDASLGLREIARPDLAGACSALRADVLAGGALDPTGCDIDVAAVHQHYLAALHRSGAVVATGARVTALAHDGSEWRIDATGAAELGAAAVVDAAGAWCDDVAALAGVAAAGITPMRRTIAVCRPGALAPDPSWPLVLDLLDGYYFRPEAGGTMVSPMDETPSPPCDARPDELDVAWAIEAVNERTVLALRSVQTSWAGLRSFAADRTPVVGFAPDAEGFFWYGGQGGYGIQMAPGMAVLAAELLLGRPLDDADRHLAAALAPDRPSLQSTGAPA